MDNQESERKTEALGSDVERGVRRNPIRLVVKWWGPILLAAMFIKFTSLMDGGKYRWMIHALLMLQGITLWEMAKDADRIEAIFRKSA